MLGALRIKVYRVSSFGFAKLGVGHGGKSPCGKTKARLTATKHRSVYCSSRDLRDHSTKSHL